MKRKFVFSLTTIIFIIVIGLILGVFFKKDNNDDKIKTIKVADATITLRTYKKLEN